MKCGGFLRNVCSRFSRMRRYPEQQSPPGTTCNIIHHIGQIEAGDLAGLTAVIFDTGEIAKYNEGCISVTVGGVHISYVLVVQALGGDDVKKLVRILVVPALI